MKYPNFIFCAVILGSVLGNPLSASASHFKLPEEIGRIEGARDLNLLQVEPSMIHERYYTTGQCEREQYIGNVLPAGAEIPDSDPAPAPARVKAQSAPVKSTIPNAVPAKSPVR